MVSMEMQQLTDGSLFWEDGCLHSVPLNPCYGTGYLSKVIYFQSGISLVIQDFSLYGDGEIRLSRKKEDLPFISFFTCFSGIGHISYTEPRVQLGKGFTNIEYSDYKSATSMDVKGNTPVRTLTVCVDPEVFAKLTGKRSEDLVEALDMLDFNAGKKNPARSRSLDFDQKICGHQAFNSFVATPHDTLFLEAKALELVALQLRQLEILTGTAPRPEPVDPHGESIFQACRILKTQMANPPRARELARRVGLNHNQLVQKFKETFGVRPYEYLRILRLEKAMALIDRRQCNITQAAFKVGYSSPSHFTNAFRKEFGITPNAYLKNGQHHYNYDIN